MVEFVRRPREARVNLFDDEFCQRREFFFPFSRAVRRLGYFQRGLRRFRSEAAFGNLLDEDAALAAQWLNAANVIPIHYDTWPVIEQDVKKYQELTESSTRAHVHIVQPGEALDFK